MSKPVYRRLLQKLLNKEESVMVTRRESGVVTKELLNEGEWLEKWGAAPHVATGENGTRIIKRFQPKPHLIILGGGHIAVPLATMGSLLNYDVIVFDDRPSFADKTRFTTTGEVICDSFDRVASRVAIYRRDAKEGSRYGFCGFFII